MLTQKSRAAPKATTAANISPAPRVPPLVLESSGPVGVGVDAGTIAVVSGEDTGTITVVNGADNGIVEVAVVSRLGTDASTVDVISGGSPEASTVDVMTGGSAVPEAAGAVGSTQVQVILAEQGSGPSVEVQVNVWPLQLVASGQ